MYTNVVSFHSVHYLVLYHVHQCNISPFSSSSGVISCTMWCHFILFIIWCYIMYTNVTLLHPLHYPRDVMCIIQVVMSFCISCNAWLDSILSLYIHIFLPIESCVKDLGLYERSKLLVTWLFDMNDNVHPILMLCDCLDKVMYPLWHHNGFFTVTSLPPCHTTHFMNGTIIKNILLAVVRLLLCLLYRNSSEYFRWKLTILMDIYIQQKHHKIKKKHWVV